MSDLSDQTCLCCSEPLERLRYFPRQLLCADDMQAEQDYFRERLRRHNRYLHGWGVVCGCTVEPLDNTTGWQVRVCPGYAVSPQGDEILIDCAVDVDLQLGAPHAPCSVRWPCPPTGTMPGGGREGETIAYIAVRYAECPSRPVSVHPAGCGCDETGCDYSRVRERFEIKVLWGLPASHEQAREDDAQWCAQLKQGSATTRQRSFPVPPCPPCETDPWVVLAAVRIPQKTGGDGAKAPLVISYSPVRVLLATQRLQVAMLCMA